MIPRQIINAWFGRGEKGPMFKHCLESQRRLCPDWPVVTIDEDTAELMAFPFMQAVVGRKEWANACALARIWGLWKHGGIYLDADVEVVKPLDGLLDPSVSFFMGWEDEQYICDATMGSEQGGKIVTDLLNAFPKESDGRAGAHTYGPTFYTTQLQLRAGEPGLILYSPEYFYPAHWRSPDKPTFTANTYTYHRWTQSWVGKY